MIAPPHQEKSHPSGRGWFQKNTCAKIRHLNMLQGSPFHPIFHQLTFNPNCNSSATKANFTPSIQPKATFTQFIQPNFDSPFTRLQLTSAIRTIHSSHTVPSVSPVSKPSQHSLIDTTSKLYFYSSFLHPF